MKSIWIIAKRELASFFDSLIAYVLIILFLGLTGFFTWFFGNNIFVRGQASLYVFFEISFLTLFFFIPAITMRSLAEENKAGTIELLLTKSISDVQIILGKFLGSLMMILIALVCTIPYYISVSQIGSIDHGAVIGGYIGLILMSATYISLGIFASGTTNNQIVAFLITLSIGVFFHFIFGLIASSFTGGIGSVFDYLSLRTHYDSISRGVIDARDLIYFASLIVIGVLLSQVSLSKRNWQN